MKDNNLNSDNDFLLEVKNLKTVFKTEGSEITAVDDISFKIKRGETIGIVGESGSGKTTLGRIMVGLLRPSQGIRLWQGAETGVSLAAQMVFQDAAAALNPRMRVRDILSEAPLFHRIVPAAARDRFVATLLERVGLDASFADRFPHQFSGGQRARIGIARALAVKPQLLVCDEPVAALDVSVQAQILNLFATLRAELGLSYVFISHDLGVVRHVADRVAVMYLGRIIESGPAAEIFAAPNHPYTQALLAELPNIALRRRSYQPIAGEIPSPIDPPRGCHFHPRCRHAAERCRIEAPRLREIAPQHASACHLNDLNDLSE